MCLSTLKLLLYFPQVILIKLFSVELTFTLGSTRSLPRCICLPLRIVIVSCFASGQVCELFKSKVGFPRRNEGFSTKPAFKFNLKRASFTIIGSPWVLVQMAVNKFLNLLLFDNLEPQFEIREPKVKLDRSFVRVDSLRVDKFE